MEAEALAPVVAAANPQPNHETKEAVVLPTAAGAAAAPGGFVTAGKQTFAGEESQSQRSDRKATSYNRFVSSAKHSGGRA